VAASGVPGYESESPIGVLAPAGTPAAIISRLHKETVLAIQEPSLREKFLSMGAETVGNTPAQFAAKINAEVSRMSKVIKAAGIRVE
jgi:tripartite-type tricarboxylate transporter receptor subunit TctC